MRPTVVALAAVAAAFAGCAIPNACVQGSQTFGDETCHEVSTMIWPEPASPDPEECAGGDLYDWRTCGGLGFTFDCGDGYYIRAGGRCPP